jgi:hypothetical protein
MLMMWKFVDVCVVVVECGEKCREMLRWMRYDSFCWRLILIYHNVCQNTGVAGVHSGQKCFIWRVFLHAQVPFHSMSTSSRRNTSHYSYWCCSATARFKQIRLVSQGSCSWKSHLKSKTYQEPAACGDICQGLPFCCTGLYLPHTAIILTQP